MKNIKVIYFGIILLLIMGGVGMVVYSMENRNKSKDSQMSDSDYESTVMVDTRGDGAQTYSIDNGSVWMSKKEFEKAYPDSDIEWWTYDEYKEFLEKEKVNLAIAVKHMKKGSTSADGEFVWTQEKADEAIKMYEQNLENINNGDKISKTIDGKDNIEMQSYSFDSKEKQYSFDITLPNGEIKSYNYYKSMEELKAAVQQYCEEQIKEGNISRDDANSILNQIK